MYPHILSKLNRTIWAATPQTLEAVRDLLQSRLGDAAMRTDFEGPPRSSLLQPSAAAAAMFGGSEESSRKKPYHMAGTTAVIPVFGVVGKHLSAMEIWCGGLDVDALVGVVEQAVADEQVEQCVLWFHSPGGVVTGVPEAARALAALNEQKTLYAYTDGMCCSAAYWLASQCEHIFASPSSDVGSIGVYLSWINAKDAYEDAGLKLQLFKAGTFKAMGHPLKDLSEEESAMLQADVDQIWADFKAACTQKRQLEESTMQGQTFSYAAQLETGLVDAHYDSIGALLRDIQNAD